MIRSKESSFTDLIQMKYPTPKQEFLPKKIASFKKFRRTQALTPITNVDTKSKLSETSSKPMTDEEFLSMLEIKEKISLTEPSEIGQSLFDLSLDLRSLTDVLNQIKFFKHNAPLHLYRYMSLIDLINAAVKCPPDATLLLLTIGGKMIKLDNYARPEYFNKLIKITQNLIIGKHVYTSYDNQKIPREKLRNLLELFKNSLNMPKKKPEGAYGTSQIERFIEEKQKEKQRQKLQNASQSCIQPKRKRMGITPIKGQRQPTKKNISHNENNTTSANIEKSDKVFSHAIKTPKTGTPRKSISASKNLDITPRSHRLSFDTPNEKEDQTLSNREELTAQRSIQNTEIGLNDNDDPVIESTESKDAILDDNGFLCSQVNHNKNKTKKPVNHLKYLQDELDIPSSVFASSSFVNILDNALDEIDESGSAVNPSGINCISKELHDILFDNDSDTNNNENTYQTPRNYDQSNTADQNSIEIDDLSDATFCSNASTGNSPKRIGRNKHENLRQYRPEPLDLSSIPMTTYETTYEDDSPFLPNTDDVNDETEDENIILPQIEDISEEQLMMIASKSSPNIAQFVLSKEDLMSRKKRGSEKYFHLDEKRIQQTCELAKLFNNWPTAYRSTKYVWEIMKEDDSFDLDTLISQIPESFGQFLITALKVYISEMLQ